MKPKELKLTELFLNELFKDAWKYLELFTGKLEYKGENIQSRRCYITFRIIYMIHTWRMNNPKFQIPNPESQVPSPVTVIESSFEFGTWNLGL